MISETTAYILCDSIHNAGNGLIGTGVIVIVLSIPLLFNLIPKNSLYGFRIKRAFESDDNWYAINKYGAKAFVLWSIPMIVCGIIFLHVNCSPLIGPLPVLFLVAAIIQTLLFARKLK